MLSQRRPKARGADHPEASQLPCRRHGEVNTRQCTGDPAPAVAEETATGTSHPAVLPIISPRMHFPVIAEWERGVRSRRADCTLSGLFCTGDVKSTGNPKVTHRLNLD